MAEDKIKCAESVWHSDGNWGRRVSCQRNAGHGPDEKYCAQHAEKFAQGDAVTWYRASCLSEYSFEIKPVEVLKDTKTHVLVKDGEQASREAKESKWYCYFQTREEAVEFYRRRIKGIRARADSLEVRLGEEK